MRALKGHVHYLAKEKKKGHAHKGRGMILKFCPLPKAKYCMTSFKIIEVNWS